MDRVPVVFIVGTAYSGTTYLSLTLGSHSQMLAIGEVEPETLNTFWTNNQLCTCLFRARECHLWKRVMRSLSRVSERETFELSDPNNDLTSFLRTTHELFRDSTCVREADSDTVKQARDRSTRNYHISLYRAIRCAHY
jgi:hypothetical protein